MHTKGTSLSVASTYRMELGVETSNLTCDRGTGFGTQLDRSGENGKRATAGKLWAESSSLSHPCHKTDVYGSSHPLGAATRTALCWCERCGEAKSLLPLPGIELKLIGRYSIAKSTCKTHGERRAAYRILVVKPEGKRPLGRPRRRWEDNTKPDLQEVRYGCMDSG
jgi:hypothetical protein